MKNELRISRIAAVVLCIASGLATAKHAAAAEAVGKPVGLKCDSLVDPLGIDTPAPVLSWRLIDSRTGARQTAYEIAVSASLNSNADL